MKNSFGRRVVSFTLAASVALPQSASVFAVSLYDDRGATTLQQAVSGERPAADAMPWVTLPARSGSANSVYPVDKDTELTTPPNTGGTTDTPKGETTENDKPPAGETTESDKPPSGSTYTVDDDTETPKPPDSGGTTDVPKDETTESDKPPSDDTYTVDDDTEMSTPPNESGIALISDGDTGQLNLTKWSFYKLGYGVPGKYWNNKYGITRYNGLFAVERDESNASPAESGYGSVSYDLNNPLIYYDVTVEDPDFYSFCVFPNAATLGRVPDLELDGWYVYNSNTASALQSQDAKDWQYDESTTSKVELSGYTESDPGYFPDSTNSRLFGYSKYGDTWDGGTDYGYGYYDSENGTPVSFVAKWKASSKSQARAISVYESGDTSKTPLTLYSENIEKQATLADADKATTENSTTGLAKTTYYLRVGADVDSLTIDLSTWELYFSDYKDLNAEANENLEEPVYQYEKYTLDNEKDYHVSVSYTCSDGTKGTVGKSGISAVMLPAWDDTTVSSYAKPNNSTDAPAHSEWTIKDIPLTAATATTTYNTITVTVTAPDNVATTTYTIQVERLTQPTVTQNPGNTPFGMIARDDGTSLTSDERKEQARDYFTAVGEDGVANRKFDAKLYPTGSNNNKGVIYRGRYSEYAWSDGNDVDTDETAIVAYLNSTFQDPGLSLTDTEGNLVDNLNGTSENGYKLYRSIQLKQAETLDPTQIGNANYGTDCWYQTVGNKGTLVDSEVYELVSTADGSDVIDLRGMNIVPGVYTIFYRYYDPVTDTTYPRENDNTADYTRTLVVLPTVGDVDMDGAITVADALYLEQMLGKNQMLGYITLNGKYVRDTASKNSTEVNDIVSLYAYRVCDVNGDGVLNDDDVTYLKTLPSLRLEWVDGEKKGNSDYFYLPTTTSDTLDRKALMTIDSGARVELVYLGKEQGTYQSGGWFDKPSGPWADSLSNEDKIEMEDVFWVGVRLQDVDSISNLETIKSLAFSVVYDSYYLEPASVLTEDALKQVQNQNGDPWNSTVSRYNIPADAGTLWNGQYTLSGGTQSSKSFTASSSTATVPLESTGKSGYLKTLTFAVELNSGSGGVLLKDAGESYLLALPFRLKRHPFGKSEAALINVNAGMSEFTLVTTKTVDGKEQLTTYAYTENDTTIQGGRTQNLKSVLGYANAEVSIPLGEDKSVVYQIYQTYDSDSGTGTNAVYGTKVNRIVNGYLTTEDQKEYPNEKATQEIPLSAEDPNDLPPGLTYNSGGWLEGMPTAAGDYTFDIGNVHFHMVVDKQELHYWVDSVASYYGEQGYRGDGNTEFTFRYDPDDIRDPSQTDGKPTEKPNGNGNELKALLQGLKGLGETDVLNPSFKAVTADGKTAVGSTTTVGSYQVVADNVPLLQNYELVYIGSEKNSKLEILKRPIKVSYINGSADNPTVVATIFSDETGAVSKLEAWRGTDVDSSKVSFTVAGANGRNDLPLTTNKDYQDGMLLPGDSLQIRYSIQYLRNDADRAWDANSAYFYLADDELSGRRSVEVTKLELVGGTNYENYTLIGELPDTKEHSGVVGEIKKRVIKKLRMESAPPMEYTYGDKLERGGELKFYIEKDGDETEGIYSYYSKEYEKYGINFYWASAAERDAYLTAEEKGEPFDDTLYASDKTDYKYQPEMRFTTDYNGRYLCMTCTTVDENNNPKTIRQYWETPLTVKPKELVLTVKTAKQYYGEDHQQGLTFTYDPKQLESMDYAKGTNLTGNGAELTTLLADYGYKAPELKAVKTRNKKNLTELIDTENLLTPQTNYTGADNYVVIYGASIDKNYKILYQYTDTQGNKTKSETFGSAVYRIEQRPIVVDGLANTVNTTETPLVQVYADTRVIAVPDCELTQEQVVLGLPQENYYLGKSDIPQELSQAFGEEATAVVNGDKIGFTYTATVIPTGTEEVRKAYLNYNGFSHGHFDMTDVDEAKGYKEYPVQISELVLTGENKDNYVLVYRDREAASLKTVNSVKNEAGIAPGSNASYPYKAATDTNNSTDGTALARVLLRPIESIEIVSAGRVTYTYGEGYSPEQRDLGSSLTDKGLTVKIKYETDNPEVRDFDVNQTEETVEFYVSSTAGETVTTSFDERSLKIYYVKNGVVSLNEQYELKQGSALTVNEHSGAQLIVTGKRGAQTEVKQSALSAKRLSVSTKTLVLQAEDVSRFYGEENPEFTYTVSAKELATWDREALGVAENETVTSAQLATLATECGYKYSQPTFRTEAKLNSDVLNGGAEGYEITGSGGELENYTLSFEAGTLYVYPRPVKITGFIQTEPVYTIYSDLTAKIYTTNLSTHRLNADGSTTAQFELGVDSSFIVKDKDGKTVTPIRNSTALLDGDEMTIKVQVNFNADDLTNKNTHDCDVTVSNATMVAGTQAAKNYVFIQNNDAAVIDNPNAKGRVELRNIDFIEVTHAPKVNYSYGDTLDLSDLVVKIHYEDTATDDMPVYYMGADQFAQYGLRVFYYESATVDIDTEEIVKKRSAQTGDHLTIAPTHDSRKPETTEFAANRMYLVVTAETKDGPDINYNDAKIVTKDGNAAQLTVAPQPIYYTLEATDKIYDGNVQTAGTITFDEAFIFHVSGEVDDQNRDGVTDLVYPVLNADYESNWTNGLYSARFEDFNAYVAENGYSFTTGTYVANDPNEPTVNQTIRWTEGYQWGNGLSFAYLDPNVAYEGEDFTTAPQEKTVQVLGLQLAGADAANYTLVGKSAGEMVDVTTNDAIGLQDEALPTATIHKANRAELADGLLPNVELDAHTNVVRINYDQTTDIIKRGSDSEGLSGEAEQYLDQVHFEYALQKLITDETTNVVGVAQWAGAQGDKEWDTGKYFGGEARRPDEITTEDSENHDPYVPKEDDIPTAEDITEDTVTKGQLYRWAEEDEGFYLDASLYPNGEVWLAYELYSTDRAPLERDTVYVPLVRAAETHNYNASLPISSMSNYLHETVSRLLEAQKARDVATAEEREAAQTVLEEALSAASEALNGAVTTAYADAQAEVELLLSEDSQELEERPVEHRDATTAVKTYKQLIETMSVKELYGENTESKEPYLVSTLEAVWFTDVQTVADKETLDVVLWNKEPARYRTYAWDNNFSAELTFDEDEPLDLSEPLEVTVTDRRVNGGEEKEHTVTVNVDNTATLYVDTNFSSGTTYLKAKQIVLRPGSILAAVGDDPVEVGVTIYPLRARVLRIIWTSSDPTVATVSEEGVIRFVGVGSAVITASVPEYYGSETMLCSASVQVTVVESWKDAYPSSIFNFGFTDAFLTTNVTDSEGGDEQLFQPAESITRGEIAQVLERFYVANPTWDKTGPTEFSDLTGEESYADAVLLLSSKGVFLGYPDGTFQGEQAVSRAELVTLLARMTGITVEDTAGQPHAFLDTGEEDTWAYAEIDALSKLDGVLLGVGDGYFDPNRAVTRSEVAALLTRLLRFPWVRKETMVIPDDVDEDHWGRDSILRAVNGSLILEETPHELFEE